MRSVTQPIRPEVDTGDKGRTFLTADGSGGGGEIRNFFFPSRVPTHLLT